IINNRVKNNWDGISLSTSDENKIKYNVLINNSDGIDLYESDKNDIFNNEVYSNNADGIYIDTSLRNVIKSNDIYDNFYGVYLLDADFNTVELNNASENSDGIYIETSDNNYVLGNYVNSNYGEGIYLETSDKNYIEDNICILNSASGINNYESDTSIIANNFISSSSNDAGISIYNSLYCSVVSNNCTNNTKGIYVTVNSHHTTLINNICWLNRGEGIKVINSDDIKIENNKCYRNTGTDGIYISRSESSTIKNNICNTSQNRGIFVTEVNGIIVENNHCFENSVGIEISNSMICVIIYNNAESNTLYNIKLDGTDYGYINNNTCNSTTEKDGMLISGSEFNAIEYNICSSNKLFAIRLQNSKNNNITNNLLNSNEYGSITLEKSDTNTIAYNNCSNNKYGIYLSTCKNNIIYRNYISYNTNRGFFFNAFSAGNSVYHNLIIQNTIQAVDDGSNPWRNSDYEGNFWSDYTGVDNGANNRTFGDGIGDTNIPHLDIDNYPFVKYKGWLYPGTPLIQVENNVDPDGSYTLNWSLTPRTTGFVLEEDTSSTFGSPKTLMNGFSLSFSLINKPEGVYYYRLIAYNSYTFGDWSPIVEMRVNLPPGVPKNLMAIPDPQGNALNITWDLYPYEISEYVLQFKKSLENDWIDLANITHPINFYYHFGLQDGLEYNYRIQSKNTYGQLSKFSAPITGIPSDTMAPAIPTILKAVPLSHDRIRIYWEQNEDDTEEYRIYRSKEISPYSWGAPIGYAYKGTDNFTDYELAEETTYYYVMKALDEVLIESEFSKAVSCTTLIGPREPEINNSIKEIRIFEDSYDDTSLNLYHLFKDVNGDVLTFDFGDNTHIKIKIYQANGTVVFIPEHNWNGVETVVFFASDDTGEIYHNMDIIVTPVNDPPESVEITSPEDNFKVDDGKLIDFRGSCTDPDTPYGDVLEYIWTSDISGIIGKGSSIENIRLPVGNHKITLTVTDSVGLNISTSIDIKIKETMESDSDSDGIPNVRERTWGLDPFNSSDADLDPDHDGLTNVEEYELGTDPFSEDTDNDGYDDSEDEFPLDPNKWKSVDTQDKGEKGEDKSMIWIAIIIIIIIVVVLLTMFILIKKDILRFDFLSDSDSGQSDMQRGGPPGSGPPRHPPPPTPPETPPPETPPPPQPPPPLSKTPPPPPPRTPPPPPDRYY
ncbi:MAG: right-handed parallel beta-helix repeat-containing protein, partial [Thermoplasmata archaeon]